MALYQDVLRAIRDGATAEDVEEMLASGGSDMDDEQLIDVLELLNDRSERSSRVAHRKYKEWFGDGELS